jgi:RNA polymerase sigma-70 factor (ECF subfamily)
MHSTSGRPAPGHPGDHQVLRALREGDEQAFETLIDAYGRAMMRVAMTYVPCHAVAEEVVQETWLGVLNGLDRFEERSSLKTWIFRILVNTAKTRAARERRTVPFSSLAGPGDDGEEPAVDPDRFLPADHNRWPRHWALGPSRWETPEDGLLSGETREVILGAIAELPAAQRAAITLRDIEGWPADEVCSALEVSDANQRVLLHRARSKVRGAIERHLDAVEPTVSTEAVTA